MTASVSTSDWVTLSPEHADALLKGLPQILRRDLRNLTASAGLQYRQSNGRVLMRSTTTGEHTIYTKPLQRADGVARADVQRTPSMFMNTSKPSIRTRGLIFPERVICNTGFIVRKMRGAY